MRGLSGSNFYVGCVSYVGQNIFYVGHNFYVGCVGKTFLYGSFFWVGEKGVGNGSKKYLD